MRQDGIEQIGKRCRAHQDQAQPPDGKLLPHGGVKPVDQRLELRADAIEIDRRSDDEGIRVFEFFIDYFHKKNDCIIKNKLDSKTEKLYKIKSIICSIYLCYYIRLINDDKRGKFDADPELQKTLLEIVNVYCEEEVEKKGKDLRAKIRNKELSFELRHKHFEKFSDLLRIEEEYLLEQIE